MPTNREIGERIGLSHSSVSRIRAGDRIPSLDVMLVIEREYGWPLANQAVCRAQQAKTPDSRAYVLKFEETVGAEAAESESSEPAVSGVGD